MLGILIIDEGGETFMTDIHEVENDQEKLREKKGKPKYLIIVICLLICLGTVGYIWYKNVQEPPNQIVDNTNIATVDIDELLKVHPDYAKLQKLKSEKIAILAKLQEYNFGGSKIEPPNIDPASNVFAQVLDEQDNLRNIKIKQQVKEESINQKKVFQNDLATELEAIKKKVNDRYANAILNCTIKLDNADNLKLSEQEKHDLIDKLDILKKERGEAVAKIEQQYDDLVMQKLANWRQVRERELVDESQVAQQAEIQDSQEKQHAENQREQKYLQDRLQMLQARKKDSERLIVLLYTKNEEIRSLRNSMIKDISDKAAIVAKQKHLNLVVSGASANLDLFGNIHVDDFDDNVITGMLVGVDAVDITDAVIDELKQSNQMNQDNKWKDDAVQ